MKVLIVGGGGREHALAWKIASSPKVNKIYSAPGNAGISSIAECINIKITEVSSLINLVIKKKIELTIVGPEAALAAGIVDEFGKRDLRIFGPTMAAAEIESSKSFAREIMQKYNIPTAQGKIFNNPREALRYIKGQDAPLVVKADGLAAGKGVILCSTTGEAEEAIALIMVKKAFGAAGEKVIIEEWLEGEEASLIAFTDGETVLPMITAQDYKAAYDGDRGPNTGGMGAHASASEVEEEMKERVMNEVFIPAVSAMASEGRKFKGALYAGLMITPAGPKVLEFNARFGDPETQAVLPLLRSDILEPIIASIDGDLHKVSLEWRNESAVCVVIASQGYPGSYEKGKEIMGLDTLRGSEEVIVFHAGTAFDNEKVVTDGGRVLGVTGTGNTLSEAISKTYQAIEKIEFDGMYYRRDIGTGNISKTEKLTKTVLFVCTGNSCRSVMAETFLRKLLNEKGRNEINVTSAGTLGIVGMKALDEVFVIMMKEEGVDVSHHRSAPLTEELISEADLILIMERHHRKSILNISPQADEKIFLLKEFSPSRERGASIEIYDPIGKPLSVYYETFAEIKESIISFLGKMDGYLK
ncbi:MAG: Phosphoribosylamine--glycine ligase [Syntrophomonadaceae bacterium]|nr:Phosphoribosylamine--glycine ligase [Bacillota bacterium]